MKGLSSGVDGGARRVNAESADVIRWLKRMARHLSSRNLNWVAPSFDLSYSAVLRSLEVQTFKLLATSGNPFAFSKHSSLSPHLLHPPRSMPYISLDKCVDRHRTWPGHRMKRMESRCFIWRFCLETMEEIRDANSRALKLVTQAELAKGYCDFFSSSACRLFPVLSRPI